jgi:hypothetical protein
MSVACRRLWFTVLRAVSARRGGAEVDLGSQQQRMLFALLLAADGRPVRLDWIIASSSMSAHRRLRSTLTPSVASAVRRARTAADEMTCIGRSRSVG